jgi:carbamoyltransferase
MIDKYKKILPNFYIKKYDSFEEINEIVADIINHEGVVAWHQDEIEWGPRALGNRSILVDARVKEIKDILNSKIKLRESFRPFAASILEEHTCDFFEINNNKDIFPNMNFVLKAKEITKKNYPAIVHVDGSSRIQTVNKKSNLKFYNLIKRFYEKFSCPLLLNTSLNIDEPICESPYDTIKSFGRTRIDCIVLQNYVLLNKSNH